jgi:hypothetical protein
VRLKIGIAIAPTLLSGLLCSCSWRTPATEEQASYLPGILANTTGIVISLTKATNEPIAVITSRDEVAAFVAATRFTEIDSPCACLGYLTLEFMTTGETVSIRYSPTENHLKFQSAWNVQALGSKEFRDLIAKHAGQY